MSPSELSLRLFGFVSQMHRLSPFVLCEDDERCFVKLTPKLAAHVVEMYNATVWNELGEHELESIIIPEEFFTGELNEQDIEAWNNHIGEYVYMGIYGEPWDMSQKTFQGGEVIRFADEFLELAIAQMDDLFNNIQTVFLHDLKNAVYLLQKEGLSDTEIEKRFKRSCNKLIK